MLRIAVIAAGMSGLVALASPAFAHDGLNHLCHGPNNTPTDDINQCCYNPDTDGPVNEESFAYCPSYLERISGGDQYSTIDRTTLAHTHICPTGTNCGPPVQLSNVKTFYSSNVAVAPQPAVAPLPPPPAPVITAAPAVASTVVAAPVAPIAGIPAVGLGGGAIVAGVLGAAAIAGIIIAVADDDNSSTSTTGTGNP